MSEQLINTLKISVSALMLSLAALAVVFGFREIEGRIPKTQSMFPGYVIDASQGVEKNISQNNILHPSRDRLVKARINSHDVLNDRDILYEMSSGSSLGYRRSRHEHIKQCIRSTFCFRKARI